MRTLLAVPGKETCKIKGSGVFRVLEEQCKDFGWEVAGRKGDKR